MRSNQDYIAMLRWFHQIQSEPIAHAETLQRFAAGVPMQFVLRTPARAHDRNRHDDYPAVGRGSTGCGNVGNRSRMALFREVDPDEVQR